jgi:hypothetical protein
MINQQRMTRPKSVIALLPVQPPIANTFSPPIEPPHPLDSPPSSSGQFDKSHS